MNCPIIPSDGGEAFLRQAVETGYGMEQNFIPPRVGDLISAELESAGQLYDLNEMNSVDTLKERGLMVAHSLFTGLNATISRIEGVEATHLPYFSVRVFDKGEHATTIHRNSIAVGPYAVGVTLRGSAPFNVYRPDLLPYNEVRPLTGEDDDPTPLASMDARAGSAWALYTMNDLVPHAGGYVDSPTQRELLIFYDMYSAYYPESNFYDEVDPDIEEF